MWIVKLCGDGLFKPEYPYIDADDELRFSESQRIARRFDTYCKAVAFRHDIIIAASFDLVFQTHVEELAECLRVVRLRPCKRSRTTRKRR